ncbi:MAG: hypothetical protein FIA96_14695 [Betaproteobacteria bacterium]|nr:hypothetical protein [Betaproteobacteria bacterium]
MSQQLNLLPKAKSRYSPATMALIILGVVLLALLVSWGVKRSMLAAARAAEVASAARLKEVNAQFEQRFRSRAAQINAEIEALKPRAAEAEQVILLAAGVGKPEGYSPYFSSLAAVREDGLWLSDVTVGQAGKSLQVTGQSLDKEAVLRYSQKLNTAFASSGIKLTELEMTSQLLMPAGTTPAADKGGGLTVIRFALR